MGRWQHAITSCAVGAIVSTAAADFVDLYTVLVNPDTEGFNGSTWTELGYDARALDTWRVYARFSSSLDSLTSVGDIVDGFQLGVYTTDPFFNAEHGSIRPPSSAEAGAYADVLWDTFVTIGATIDNGQPPHFPDGIVQFSPGFAEQVDGLADSFLVSDAGWYVAGFPPQGDAVGGVVLVAQFTVPEGASVEGQNWRVSGVDASGEDFDGIGGFLTGDPVPPLALFVPGSADDIQEAMAMAPEDEPIQILVAPGVWSGPVDFLGKPVTLIATDGPDVTTIDGGGLGAAVRFGSTENEDAALVGFTILGGSGEPANDGSGELIGGGIVIDGGAPHIIDCVLVGNTADRGGGASVRGASPTFEGCTFTGGTAGRGGAVSIEDDADALFLGCEFVGNAADEGGAIETYGATATFEDCDFEANVATFAGGAISGSESTLLLTRCAFDVNHADGSDARGGAIATAATTVVVDLCAFDDNVATVGGAVAGDGSPTTLTASTFTGNTAVEAGGAVAGRGSLLVATICEFQFNRADGIDGRGGAVFGDGVTSLYEGCDFRGNTAGASGGTIDTTGDATTTVATSTFCGSDLSGAWTDGGDNAFDFACASGVGTVENGRMGDVLANAGDVDGDGFDDVIVGAPHHDGLATESGRVFVYSARTGERLHTFGSAGPGNRFGWAVAGVGDIDGDGHADLAIGAPFVDQVSNNAGKVTLFSGATGQIIRWHLHGMTGDRFGAAIAGGFDLDGDGVPDYVIGAPFNDDVARNAGRIIIYSGATGSVLSTRWGENGGDLYGSSLAMLERANADGLADILVGAPRNDQRDTNAGKTYVLAGGSLAVLHVRLGRAKGDRFGTTVAALGDVDGDGRDDYAVGSPWHQSRGRVDVYSGRAGQRLFFARGEATGDRFGSALAGVMDMDGDGRSDVLVGAPRSDVNGASAGRAYLYGAEGDLLLTVEGASAGDRLGASVAGCADLSGDGLGEVAVGVPGIDIGAGDVGRVEIVLSSTPP